MEKKEIIQVRNLVTALEKATLMAKHLPSTTTRAVSDNTTDCATIYASLRAAHHQLSLFLAQIPQPDNIDDDDDDPMRIGDDEQQAIEEEDSKIETMEERLKDISIHNNYNSNRKRLKRSLSWASLDCEIDSARVPFDCDPHVTRLRALDLIYQFHS